MEAMWDFASQLWVPGRLCVHGRPYLSFCPVTLQHSVSGLDKYADGCLFEKGAICPQSSPHAHATAF